jgi:hypothetical protein
MQADRFFVQDRKLIGVPPIKWTTTTSFFKISASNAFSDLES